MKDLFQTNPMCWLLFSGGTQFSNLHEGLEGAEILRFQEARVIQIADHFRRSGVSRECYNKTLQVQKAYSIYLDWYKPRL